MGAGVGPRDLSYQRWRYPEISKIRKKEWKHEIWVGIGTGMTGELNPENFRETFHSAPGQFRNVLAGIDRNGMKLTTTRYFKSREKFHAQSIQNQLFVSEKIACIF